MAHMNERSHTAAQDPVGRRKILVVADDAAETRLALSFAALRASHTGGHLTILYVIEPSEFEHWVSVGETMRQEAYEVGEELLKGFADAAYEEAGVLPELIIKEGAKRDVVVELLGEEPDIAFMVLGAAVGKEGPGDLVTGFVTRPETLGSRPVPVVIVPGGMTRDDIHNLV